MLRVSAAGHRSSSLGLRAGVSGAMDPPSQPLQRPGFPSFAPEGPLALCKSPARLATSVTHIRVPSVPCWLPTGLKEFGSDNR